MKDKFGYILSIICLFIAVGLLSPMVYSDTKTTVSTIEAADISYTNATFHGEITAIDSDVVDAFFRYEEEEDESETEPIEMESALGYNTTVVDLKPRTDYEFKAVVNCSGEEKTGDWKEFSTESHPSVVTKDARDVKHDSAVLRGNLTNIGAEEDVNAYFNWTDDEGWNQTELQTVEEEGIFTEEIPGLNHNSTYEFEALVEWGEDNKSEGGTVKFETRPQIYVKTLEAEEIFTDSAVLRGELLGDEDKIDEKNVSVMFYWTRDADDWKQTDEIDMDSAGIFEEELTDLDPGTEYEFEADLTVDGKSYGTETFLTTPEFNLTYVEVDEEEVYVDEEFGIETEIENLGEIEYEYEVRFYVDGNEKDTVAVNVSEESTETVETEISVGSSGTYDIEAKVLGESIEEEDALEVYDRPEVETMSPTEVGSNYAVLKGEILEMGMEDDVTVFFRYGEEGTRKGLWAESTKQEMDEEEEFSQEVSLDEEKEYEYKAVLEWNDNEDTGHVFSLEPDACEYMDWENRTCGGWECGNDEIHQAKRVTLDSPSFCPSKLNRCIDGEGYCGMADVELEKEKMIVNITQGKQETNNITVENTGTVDLEDLELTVEGAIPEEWYDIEPSSIDIDQLDTSDFQITLFPEEGTPVGKYSIVYTVNLEDGTASVEGEVWIHPLEDEIEEIEIRQKVFEEDVTELRNRVDKLAAEADVGYIEVEISNLEDLLMEARNHVDEENYVITHERLMEAELLMTEIKEDMERIEEEMAMPWLWIGSGILAIIVGALLVYMLLPPAEGYSPTKGYSSPGHISPKEKIKEFSGKIKKRIFGEEEEGYRYSG